MVLILRQAIITEQFLAYLNVLQVIDVEAAGEFLVMAATLMEIKSKMLLPHVEEPKEEAEDPREELVQRLQLAGAEHLPDVVVGVGGAAHAGRQSTKGAGNAGVAAIRPRRPLARMMTLTLPRCDVDVTGA